MANRLAYSTDKQLNEESSKNKKFSVKPKPLASKGPVKIRTEKKGRRGKVVTILFNLPFSLEEIEQFTKKIRTNLSCGATYKNGEIIVQGDSRDKLQALLDEVST